MSYIITCNFSKNDIDHIQYLCKQVQVNGWVPKQPTKLISEKVQTSSRKLSKTILKQRLMEAMDNIDDYSKNQIMKMIKDAASTESDTNDNGYMCSPQGLALAYTDPDYE